MFSPANSISDTITNLKFISTLKSGDKINTSLLYVESNSIFTPLYRLFRQESRNETIKFITVTIDNSFDIINNITNINNISDQILFINIITDIVKAIYGLKNIQDTYISDKLFICKIDTFIDTIYSKCITYKNKYHDIFPPDLILDTKFNCNLLCDSSKQSKNKTNIDENKTLKGKNETNIDENETNIDENKTNIDENKILKGKNETNIDENKHIIPSKNETNIDANKTLKGKK